MKKTKSKILVRKAQLKKANLKWREKMQVAGYKRITLYAPVESHEVLKEYVNQLKTHTHAA